MPPMQLQPVRIVARGVAAGSLRLLLLLLLFRSCSELDVIVARESGAAVVVDIDAQGVMDPLR